MIVEWTKSAVADVAEARSYIEQENPRAAADLAERILRRIDDLRVHPQLGRMGRLKGTLELVVPDTPYLIIYRLKSSRLQLLRVYHAHRRWPPGRIRS